MVNGYEKIQTIYSFCVRKLMIGKAGIIELSASNDYRGF